MNFRESCGFETSQKRSYFSFHSKARIYTIAKIVTTSFLTLQTHDMYILEEFITGI